MPWYTYACVIDRLVHARVTGTAQNLQFGGRAASALQALGLVLCKLPALPRPLHCLQ